MNAPFPLIEKNLHKGEKMEYKIFELIQYGAILLIGFSLGGMWQIRNTQKILDEFRKLMADWTTERKKKSAEIDEALNKMENILDQMSAGLNIT